MKKNGTIKQLSTEKERITPSDLHPAKSIISK